MVTYEKLLKQQYTSFRRFLDTHKDISKFDNSPVYHYNENNCQFIVILNGSTTFNQILAKRNLTEWTVNTFDTDILVLTNNCDVKDLIIEFGNVFKNVRMTSNVEMDLFRYYIEPYTNDIDSVTESLKSPYCNITIKKENLILECCKSENENSDLINTFTNSDFVIVYLIFRSFD